MTEPVTICFVYFKSLTLANLEASLVSVRRQDLSDVDSIVILDNDTEDPLPAIKSIVRFVDFPIPVRVISEKHGDASRTHSWSTNAAIKEVKSPWLLFTRADYLLDFGLLNKFMQIIHSRPHGWNGFVTANVFHLNIDVQTCDQTYWRQIGPHALRFFPGAEADYTLIDAGVWMARKSAFDLVGGLNETLSVWGHAQTDFQYRLHRSGVDFVRVPEVLFYHPQHGGARDIDLAHQQLLDQRIDIHELWKRYEGVKPY